MDIAAIAVERADRDRYCGLLTFADAQGEGQLWWSVERIDDTRVRVGFVQGDRPDWLDLVELHAAWLSDGIIEAISHRRAALAVA